MALTKLIRRAALALALAAASSLAAAGTVHFNVNTAGFGVGSGYLDLQFMGASGSVLPATATVTNLTGFSDPVAFDLQNATAVTGGYAISNTSGFNDALFAVDFGGVLGFDVSFSGTFDPAAFVNSSRFGVAAFAPDLATVLGNADLASGFLAWVDYTPASSQGGAPVVAPQVIDGGSTSAATVPEPSSWALAGLGAAMMALALRRRRA